MTLKNFDAASYLEFMAPYTGIEIKEEWKSEVTAHLDTAARMKDIIDGANVDDDSIHLANTFSPN